MTRTSVIIKCVLGLTKCTVPLNKVIILSQFYSFLGEYDQNLCPPGNTSCEVCPDRKPSCVGLPDGAQPFPTRLWMPDYVQCYKLELYWITFKPSCTNLYGQLPTVKILHVLFPICNKFKLLVADFNFMCYFLFSPFKNPKLLGSSYSKNILYINILLNNLQTILYKLIWIIAYS